MSPKYSGRADRFKALSWREHNEQLWVWNISEARRVREFVDEVVWIRGVEEIALLSCVGVTSDAYDLRRFELSG
jgi:hypothetical protein